MSRWLLVLLWSVALALLWATSAHANVPTKPYTFVPNTTIFSAQVNADFDPLYSVLNGGLDSSNISGARGIGANYIVASGAGNTGVFQAGAYTFGPATTTQVPLGINGLSGQTADLLDLAVGGVLKASVSNAGVLTTPGISNGGYEIFTGTVGAGAGATWAAGSGSGLQVNTASGKTIFFSINGNQVASIGPALVIGAGNPGASAGDGAFGRTGSSGAIFLGGVTSSGTIDYGVTTAGKITLAAPANVTGLLGANGGLSGTTGTFSGALTANGGLSGTTGTFSGALTANGGLSGTTGAFSGALTANGGMAIADNTSINYGGQPVLRSDGAATIIQGRTAASGIYIQNAAATANNVNFPDAGGISLIRGGITGAASISSTGTIASQGTYVLPVFNASGGALGTTLHGAVATCTMSAANNCTITLSGASAFTSASTYACSASSSGPNQPATTANASGTSTVVNTTTGVSTSGTYVAVCVGT